MFKTLVARGDRNGVCFAVVPGDCRLDLKALAMVWIVLARYRGLGRDFALHIVRRPVAAR